MFRYEDIVLDLIDVYVSSKSFFCNFRYDVV
jgi:hypothetical protein